MNRLRTFIFATCIAAAAGCGTTAVPTAPEIEARFEGGGFTYGGGSFVGDGTTCEERGGGFTYGGGSVVDPCPPPPQP
jgi:hypothetical protein